jgi:hypothetical protein
MNEQNSNTPPPQRSKLLRIVYIPFSLVAILLIATLIAAVITALVTTVFERFAPATVIKMLKWLNSAFMQTGVLIIRIWNFFFGWALAICVVCWIPSHTNVIPWGKTGVYSHPLCQINQIVTELDSFIEKRSPGGGH